LLVAERLNGAHRVRSWLAASAVAMLLLVLFAAPISAAAGVPKLSDAVVAPRTGTPKSTIVITVTYQNDKGWPAASVTARVGTVDKTMTRVPGGDWRKGVAFRWSGKLPLGSYAVVIRARSTHRGDVSLGAGTVKISPPATPKPTPKPEPKATPRPTPKPTPKPIAAPEPTAGSLAGPSLTAFTTPAPTATRILTAMLMAMPTATPSAPPITAALGSTDGANPPGSNGTTGPTGPAGAGNPSGGWGPLASFLAISGLHGPTLTGLTIGPTLVTTTGAVAFGMAFGLFGRKRREDESDDVLSAAAASGVGFMPHDGAVAVSGIAAASGAVLDVDDTEALMPRWRRPSLIQARKADPIRDNEPAPRLTFDHGLVGPLDGRERKVIRYRVVRLLDSPDELRGAEIGYLDQGDEVQLLEKYGAYWLVLSPDGQQGWLHKMTLGDVFEDDGPPSEGPVATMPIAAETWTMGESDIDGDVFEAYLESRRRRGD
jgi:hypothetical protein